MQRHLRAKSFPRERSSRFAKERRPQALERRLHGRVGCEVVHFLLVIAEAKQLFVKVDVPADVRPFRILQGSERYRRLRRAPSDSAC